MHTRIIVLHSKVLFMIKKTKEISELTVHARMLDMSLLTVTNCSECRACETNKNNREFVCRHAFNSSTQLLQTWFTSWQVVHICLPYIHTYIHTCTCNQMCHITELMIHTWWPVIKHMFCYSCDCVRVGKQKFCCFAGYQNQPQVNLCQQSITVNLHCQTEQTHRWHHLDIW